MERIRLGGHSSPKLILDSKCVVLNKTSPSSNSTTMLSGDSVVADGRHQIIRPTPRRAIDISPNDNSSTVRSSQADHRPTVGERSLVSADLSARKNDPQSGRVGSGPGRSSPGDDASSFSGSTDPSSERSGIRSLEPVDGEPECKGGLILTFLSWRYPNPDPAGIRLDC